MVATQLVPGEKPLDPGEPERRVGVSRMDDAVTGGPFTARRLDDRDSQLASEAAWVVEGGTAAFRIWNGVLVTIPVMTEETR